jgi:hypothetical protein
VSYGYHILRKGEGRNDPFTTIITRFKHPPRVIIYDFACQFMEYCLNRAPGVQTTSVAAAVCGSSTDRHVCRVFCLHKILY